MLNFGSEGAHLLLLIQMPSFLCLFGIFSWWQGAIFS